MFLKNREQSKNLKVWIAGIATGICLMSFVTVNNIAETYKTYIGERDRTKITETDKTKITETDNTTITEPDTTDTKITETDKTKITETDNTTIAEPDTTDTITYWLVLSLQIVEIVSAGVGVGFGAAYLAQDIEERRKYKLLSQSNSRIIRLLCRKNEPKPDLKLKETLESQLKHNFEEENKLLNDDSITHSSIEESMNKNFESMKELISDNQKSINHNSQLISNSQKSINDKLDNIKNLLKHSPKDGSRQRGNSSSSQEKSMANGKA